MRLGDASFDDDEDQGKKKKGTKGTKGKKGKKYDVLEEPEGGRAAS